MEAKIQKQVVDYFSYFEEFYNAVNTRLKDCQKCVVSINKLCVKCKNIKVAVLDNTPLEKFDNLKEALTATIHNLISEEIQDIKSHLSHIEDFLEKLYNKKKTLVESCSQIDFTQDSVLIRGSPLQPSLKQLLEYSESTTTFGSIICCQINNSLQVLTLKGLNAALPIENFKIQKEQLRIVNEIISYTSFCSENQI